MRPIPIRLRLTLWYFLILAAALTAFAFFTLAALKHAVHRTVDSQLNAHMAAVQQIVNEDKNRTLSALTHDLDEDVELAPDLTLLEIWGRDGQIVYRSTAMNRIHIADGAPSLLNRPVTRSYPHHPLRVLVKNLSTAESSYTVMVAIPIHDFAEALRQVKSTLWIAIPLLLLLSVAGGYWIAGRALSPIRSMIADTDAIHPGDLSTRLAIPPANDELRRLALTLNRMLSRLQAGFERITQFTADASHELRTPVALLRTRTEVLLRRPRSSEEYRTALEANLDELERTSTLLEKLMLLARADAGAETLHFAKVDLTELVRAAADAMQPLAERKHFAWCIELPQKAIHVHGDESSLRRLLLVLLDNAVKYTPENGSVRITVESSGNTATVAVSDTGIGIEKEILPNIFDRFYRADSARAADGAGLGLSIGQWIAQRHDGSISVKSTPSEGSIFSVRLPITREQQSNR
jgi:heavy metal sensor kinase